MFSGNNNLSLAASAIYRITTVVDPMAEWACSVCSEVGEDIARGRRSAAHEALADLGFTPREYNRALRERLAPDYPRMSYRIFGLLGILEVPECKVCGGPLEEQSHWTPAYGGGYDTMTRCTSCGNVEVYV